MFVNEKFRLDSANNNNIIAGNTANNHLINCTLKTYNDNEKNINDRCRTRNKKKNDIKMKKKAHIVDSLTQCCVDTRYTQMREKYTKHVFVQILFFPSFFFSSIWFRIDYEKQ